MSLSDFISYTYNGLFSSHHLHIHAFFHRIRLDIHRETMYAAYMLYLVSTVVHNRVPFVSFGGFQIRSAIRDVSVVSTYSKTRYAYT